eukprot:Skav227958  [mRNA]  locus=scaffold146:724551:725105:- [translate_table: standard]
MQLEFLLSTSIPAGLFLFFLLVTTWQLHWAWTLLGAILLDQACLALKQLIKEPRPAEPAFVLESEGLYGMPSEHAAFVAYLLAHLGMRLWMDPLCFHWSLFLKSLASVALLIWGSTLVILRFAYGAHSLPQLLLGGCIGFTAGLCWSRLEAALHGPLQDWQRFIDSSRLCVQSLYGIGSNQHAD